MEDNKTVRLFLVDPEKESEEYRLVSNEFLQTLPNANILQVQQVQNKVLWEQYFICSVTINWEKIALPWHQIKQS